MQPIISIKNISKSFRGKKIIDNFSVDVYENEVFGLIGKSGSGKTTILRVLIGFYEPESGYILSYGKNLIKEKDIAKKKFGFSTQDHCFYQDLTLLENLKYFGKLYQIRSDEIAKRSEELLKLVELWDSKTSIAKDLSGGMQRRFDLCCALMHNPEILLLDEPTAGLDPLLRKHMWSLIKKINLTGVTILISSHMLEDMEQLCTRVAMIQEGRLLGQGTPEELKNLYSRNEEIHLETYPGQYKVIVDQLVKKGIPITYVNYEKHKVILYTPTAEKTLHAIIHLLESMNENLLDIDVKKPSLSEVFEAFSNYTPVKKESQSIKGQKPQEKQEKQKNV